MLVSSITKVNLQIAHVGGLSCEALKSNIAELSLYKIKQKKLQETDCRHMTINSKTLRKRDKGFYLSWDLKSKEPFTALHK